MGDAAKKSVDGWIQRLDELLHDKDFWLAAQMDQLEQKTRLKRVHIAVGEYGSP